MMGEISSLKETIWKVQQLISNSPGVSENEEALIVSEEVFTKVKRVRKSCRVKC